MPSAQRSQRTEIEVEISGIEAVTLRKLVNGRLQTHQCGAKPLDLFGSQGPLANPPHGLALQQLTNKLDQRQNEADH